MNITIEEGLKRIFRYHKFINNLNTPTNIDENINNDIYLLPNLFDDFKSYIHKLFEIENSHANNNNITPFGIINSNPTCYKYLMILSFLHKHNSSFSKLHSLNTYHIDNTSNWSYKIDNINDNNTINTSVIVTTPQAILSWKEVLQNVNGMNIHFITSIHEFNTLNMDNLNDKIIIISLNMWNHFAFHIPNNKFILRLLVDDIHLFNSINSASIKFKFCWIITHHLDELLLRYIKYMTWTDTFNYLCNNIIKNEDDFKNIIQLSKTYNDEMTDEYINSMASDKEIIIHNFSYIFKHYKHNKWSFQKYYNTPMNIFENTSYKFSRFRLKKGFFNNLLEGIANIILLHGLYNNIVTIRYFYVFDNMTNISIEDINCAVEINDNNAKSEFIKENKNNPELLTYYFNCFNDTTTLLKNITDEYEKVSFDTISRSHINTFNRIKERLSTIQACPICFNNVEDNMIITSCCSYIFHYTCLFNCFTENMNCPMCRLPVLFHKTCIVDSKLTNIVKISGRNEILLNILKQSYNKVLIIDGIHQLNILDYVLKLNNITTNIYTFSDKIKNINTIMQSQHEEKSIYILMKYSLSVFKCINFSNIDLVIIYDNSIGHTLAELMDQLIYNRTKNLKILYLKTII
jgi:hypothetical protein